MFANLTKISRNSKRFRPLDGAVEDSTLRLAAMKVLSTDEILTYWSRNLALVARSQKSS